MVLARVYSKIREVEMVIGGWGMLSSAVRCCYSGVCVGGRLEILVGYD